MSTRSARAALTVTAVQAASGLDPAINRTSLERLVPSDAGALTVLPEAYARDYGEPGSDLSQASEPLDGEFDQALTDLAVRTGGTVVAGMFETNPEDPRRPFNTLLARSEARREAYRKIHLYDAFGLRETDRVTPGEVAPVVLDVQGWSVGLMTCYDLRFPEMGRMLVDAGAEVLVVSAAWVAGERKLDHWRTLAIARAMENTVYLIAVGQPAPRYTGHSLVVNPHGEVVAEAGDAEAVLQVTLSPELLTEARALNPSLGNRRLRPTR